MSRVIIWPTIGLGLLTGCAAATSSANPADSLSALRPQYPSTYVRHPSAPACHPKRHHPHRGRSRAQARIDPVSAMAKSPLSGPTYDSRRPKPSSSTAPASIVTPGLIDAHSHLGVYAAPGTESQSDGNEATDPDTAQVWAEHSFWPQDPQIPLAIAGGITVIQVLPGSANLIGGRSAMLQADPGAHGAGDEVSRRALRPEDGVRRESQAGLPGEGPLHPDGQRRRVPGRLRRGGAVPAASGTQWLAKKEGGPARPRSQAGDSGRRAAGARSFVQNHCYRADEMAQMLDLAQEFGFHIRSFHHAVEAYKIADLLAPGQRRGRGLGRLVGLQDGVARRHPRERCPAAAGRRPRHHPLRQRRRNPAAQPGSRQGDVRRP